MATKRIRCVNADGKIRELPETLVNNRKGFMAKYGWRVEDVKAEAPIELPKEVLTHFDKLKDQEALTDAVLSASKKLEETIDKEILGVVENMTEFKDVPKKDEAPQERVIKRRKPRTKKA